MDQGRVPDGRGEVGAVIIPAGGFILGENDRFGDCFFVAIANAYLAATGNRMADVEIMAAANIMEGLNPYDRTTDVGEPFQKGIDFIAANGWPGNPSIRPSFLPVTADEILASDDPGDGWLAALMLPVARGEYDWTDSAVWCQRTGVYGHAVFLPAPLTCVTWGKPQGYSAAWLRRYLAVGVRPVWGDEAIG